jgi:hypothetical protein
MNKITTANKERVLGELQAQNLQPKDKVKSWKLTWRKKDSKLHEPLLVDIGTLEEAKAFDQDCLLHDCKLKNSKLFYNECIMIECFKCYCYSQIAVTCQGSQPCGNCK